MINDHGPLGQVASLGAAQALIAEQRQRIEDLEVTVQQRDAAIDSARRMLDRLPFDFGSNNWYESCDQVVREVAAIVGASCALLDQYETGINSMTEGMPDGRRLHYLTCHPLWDALRRVLP